MKRHLGSRDVGVDEGYLEANEQVLVEVQPIVTVLQLRLDLPESSPLEDSEDLRIRPTYPYGNDDGLENATLLVEEPDICLHSP